MTKKSTKTPSKKEKKKTIEKPVSLAGPSFDDVLAALLKTKPMPKEHEKTTTPKKGRKKKQSPSTTDKKETDD